MTAVEQLLRQFALLGYDVHKYETIINEALEIEKEQKGYSKEDLFKILLDFVAFPHHDMEPRGSIIERYLNELSKKKFKN